jgi:hypothetical protein
MLFPGTPDEYLNAGPLAGGRNLRAGSWAGKKFRRRKSTSSVKDPKKIGQRKNALNAKKSGY